jgi:predicted ATPase/Tfp pilus assembly protein PilF
VGILPGNPGLSVRTPDRRSRVYVSANAKELVDERNAARQAIFRLHLTPVMFDAGTHPHPPRDLYQTYLPQSDIFIGIYWEQYGWTAPDEQISSLEDEYNLSNSLPRLIYVKSPAPRREPALKDLLARIKQDGLSYRYFSNSSELAGLIENDLKQATAQLLPPNREGTKNGQTEAAGPPTTLPMETVRFIGREIQVEAIRRLLLQQENRLVSLTGPGGAGKTLLALNAARSAQDQFPDGIFYIDLAEVGCTALLLPTIARAAGQSEAAGEQLAAKVKSFLRSRRCLLVLDNLDRLISAVPTMKELLSTVPRLKVLFTSQAALRLSGELEFPVLPLSLPSLSHRTADTIGESEAVRLFTSQTSSAHALNAENAPLIAEVCRRLDGLPLAIELAAAQVRRLPLADLLADLDNHVKSPGPEAQNLPPRQRTMRAAVEWGFERLEPGEKTLLTRLAVFLGGGTLEAAQTICSPDEKIDVLESSSSLVNQNWLRRELDVEGKLRFTMPDTLREFAMERLDDSSEKAILQERHARYYRELASEILHGQSPLGLERLEFEIENLRAAMEWSMAIPGAVDFGVRLANDLFSFWSLHGHLVEAQYWLGRMIEANAEQSSVEQTFGQQRAGDYAGMLAGAGIVAGWLGDPSAASRLLDESIPLLRRTNDRQRLAQALMNLGVLALSTGLTENARPALEEALRIFRDLNDRSASAVCLMRLGEVAMAEHRPEEARRLLAETTSIARGIGDAWLLPTAINIQGDIARLQGEYNRAGGYYDESGALFHQINARGELARVFHNQAYVALRRGDTRLAGSLFRQSLETCHALGIQRGTAECLAGLAGVEAAQGKFMPAARLIGFAQAFLEQLGMQWQPADHREIELTRASLQQTLGEELFGLEESAGRKQYLANVLAAYGLD